MLYGVTGISLDQKEFKESNISDFELLTEVLVVLLVWYVSLSSHLFEIVLELVHALGWHLYPIVPDHLANWSD